MITTVCKISYGSQTVPPIVPAVQGDTGRAISFEIADFTPPAGATATYFILKPSGEAIYNSATITNNSILCELTAQSLAEAGENRMQVRVLQGENIVTSFEVILMVRTFLGDDAIQSGTEMNIFDQAVAQATEQFQTNAEQIVEDVIESIPADYTALTEEVDELNERLDNLEPGLSDEAKAALLACFAKVAWIDEHGQDYYDTLESSLYPSNYPKIVAVFNSGQNTIYTDDTLDSLKQYLTVTYFETEESTGTIVSSANYTLSGALVVGTTTITVVYNNLTTSFKVNNIVDFYNIAEWSISDNAHVRLGNVVTEFTTTIVSNVINSNRAVLYCDRGKGIIYNYNNNNPIPFTPDQYPLPVPNGATSITIECTASMRTVIYVFRYNDGNNYTLAQQINSTSSDYGGGTFEITATGDNRFAIVMILTSNSVLPGIAKVTYGFE